MMVIYKGVWFETGNERHNEIELYFLSGGFFKVVDKSELTNPVRDKPKGRSLNPTAKQMQYIKCKHLEELYNRTGITPAMKFYGSGIGPNDWVEKPYSYLDKAIYNNSVNVK